MEKKNIFVSAYKEGMMHILEFTPTEFESELKYNPNEEIISSVIPYTYKGELYKFVYTNKAHIVGNFEKYFTCVGIHDQHYKYE